MVYVTSSCSNFNDFSDTLGRLVNIVSNKLQSIFKYSKNNDVTNMVKVEEYASFQNDFEEVIDLTRKIANTLKVEHILIKEYYDFREIQRLIIKTLKEDLNIEKLEILSNILEKLIELTNFKLELLSKYGELAFNSSEFKEEFKEEYTKFHMFLFKSKKEYYNLNKNSHNIDSKKYFDLISESILN